MSIPPNTVVPGNPPVTIINNVYNYPPKEEGGGYVPGRSLYYLLEGAVHAELLGRCVTNAVADPIYRTTYAIAFAAGATLGLYQAMYGEEKQAGLEERAKTFSEGSLSTKAIMLAELALQGPVALRAAETVLIADKLTAGGLVATGWAFSLGSDFSHLVYKNLKAEKPAKGASV